MSESAANVKLLLFQPLRKTALSDTLQATGAEDKPLLGSKLSADLRARPGWGSKPDPSDELVKTGMASKRKIPGVLGTESPANTSF
jgi:hypothetical protein